MIGAIRIPKPAIRSTHKRGDALLAAFAASLLLLSCTGSNQGSSPSPGTDGSPGTPATIDRLP